MSRARSLPSFASRDCWPGAPLLRSGSREAHDVRPAGPGAPAPATEQAPLRDQGPLPVPGRDPAGPPRAGLVRGGPRQGLARGTGVLRHRGPASRRPRPGRRRERVQDRRRDRVRRWAEQRARGPLLPQGGSAPRSPRPPQGPHFWSTPSSPSSAACRGARSPPRCPAPSAARQQVPGRVPGGHDLLPPRRTGGPARPEHRPARALDVRRLGTHPARRPARGLEPRRLAGLGRADQAPVPQGSGCTRRLPGRAFPAPPDLDTFVDAPRAGGARAVDVWTWRQPYSGSTVSLLDEALRPNALWVGLRQRRDGGAVFFTHMTPSAMPTDAAGIARECAVVAQVFSAVFVAAGTG